MSRQRIQARIATADADHDRRDVDRDVERAGIHDAGEAGVVPDGQADRRQHEDQDDDRRVEARQPLVGVARSWRARRASYAAAVAPANYTRPMSSGLSARGHGPAVPRILLVDDDRDLLVPLAEQLRLDGFDVTTARDGEEALRRLDSAWPDLLIIDLLMPRMDGLTLAREIKARADLPIIVLSAIDAGDNKADLLDEFAEDYITKPYHYSELRARIQRVLRRVGDRVPRKGLDLGPDLVLELHQRRAIVRGEPVQLTPTESRLLFALAANLGQDRHDRDAAVAWLGRDRRGRAVLRLGDDASPAPEARGRREPATPPADRPGCRLSAGGDRGSRPAAADAVRRAGPRTPTTTRHDPAPGTAAGAFQPLVPDPAEPDAPGRRDHPARRSSAVLLLASGAVDPQIGERLLLFMFAIAIAIGVLGGSASG